MTSRKCRKSPPQCSVALVAAVATQAFVVNPKTLDVQEITEGFGH
jgi:hypothetical protein